MHLQAIGVFSITAIIRPDRRLNIGHIPWFRAEYTQKGGRVHGAGADLGVVWLPDDAAPVSPVGL